MAWHPHAEGTLESGRAVADTSDTMRRCGLLLIAAVLATATACTGFREVRPGVFRSGQPSDDQLLRRIDDHGIKTIVCLRGPTGAAAASARVAVLPGIRFWNVPMSATRLPPPATLLELWRVAEEGERPLWMHCRAGVDRTGLASAIVVLHDTGDLAAARAQLSWWPHGHVGLQAWPMSDVLDRYSAWHGRLAFPDWVRTIYAGEFEALAGATAR